MTLIGSFALIGFPFLTGYYSKDFILELACSKLHFTGNLAYWLGVPAASFTTFYSYRLLFLTFLNANRSFKGTVSGVRGPHALESIPLILLAFGSLFIGYLTKDMIIGLGSAFWGNSIFVCFVNTTFLEAEYLPYHIKMIPFIFSHLGIFFAYHTTFFLSSSSRGLSWAHDPFSNSSFQKNIYWRELSSIPAVQKMHTFYARSWGFDDLYNRIIVQNLMSAGYHITFRLFDAGWIAHFGPYGISKTITSLSRKFSSLATGYVWHYGLIMTIAIALLVLFFFSGHWVSLLEQRDASCFALFLTFFYLISVSFL
jgi:NADH-ubiquinone oxidoreductase chain 5